MSIHPNLRAAITKHGMRKTREYNKYAQAKSRCQCVTNTRYKDYGGRGIEFRFASFEEFFSELGVCPPDKTLDRIDNNGHYEAGNVRWATWTEQFETRRPWRTKCLHGKRANECKQGCSKSLCKHGNRKNRCKHRKPGELCV